MRERMLTSRLARPALIPMRYWAGRRYLTPRNRALIAWTIRSREYTNYTYDLTELNMKHLAAFVSLVTGVSVGEAAGYIAELDDDRTLRDHIVQATIASPRAGVADHTPKYARRAGWYAIVRALKPNLVVETGVDKGLGSVVLSAALLRNVKEGSGAGRYLGTDINPSAGYLLTGAYANVGEVIYGDSIESLRTVESEIDLFINDSDHSAEYERCEYQVIQSKLSPSAVVLADNAHSNDELMQFAEATGRRFAYFAEQPDGHWYPGAGIGAAFTSAQLPAMSKGGCDPI